MDWAIKVELEIQSNGMYDMPSFAADRLKRVLERLIRDRILTHYHLLSEPRKVES